MTALSDRINLAKSKFDPSKHPRDREGRFREITGAIAALGHGEVLHLSDGQQVRAKDRETSGGLKVREFEHKYHDTEFQPTAGGAVMQNDQKAIRRHAELAANRVHRPNDFHLKQARYETGAARVKEVRRSPAERDRAATLDEASVFSEKYRRLSRERKRLGNRPENKAAREKLAREMTDASREAERLRAEARASSSKPKPKSTKSAEDRLRDEIRELEGQKLDLAGSTDRADQARLADVVRKLRSLYAALGSPS